MSQLGLNDSNRHLTRLIRVGGVGAVLTVVIYVLYQSLLIPPSPPADVPLEEYRAYVVDAADALILAVGLRNLILAFLLIFAVSAYIWTSGGKRFADNPWGAIGLLGSAALLAVGVTSNTLRTVAFLTAEGVSDQPDQFAGLLNLNSVLDRVLQLFTGLMYGGFCAAGLSSRTMPKWLAGLGLVYAATTVVTTVGIAWVMSDAKAPGMLLMGRTLLGLVWFLSMGVLMAWQPSAWRERTHL